VRTRRRHPRRPSGERANQTRDLFERVITRRTLPAFAHVDTMGVVEKLSFADLARRAARWSWLLRAHRIANGDRVVVIAGRRPEWLAATLGALNGGAIGVPLPESASAEDVEAIVQHAGASLVVAPSALCGEREDIGGAAVLRVDDAQGALADQPTSAPTYDTVGRDLAMLLYERDAEGELRAAAHTHQSLLAQADAGELWLRATPGDRLWSTAEPGSTESVWSALAAWSQATELVVADGDPAPHDAVRLMELLVVQLLWLTPDRYRGLADIEWPRWLDAPRIRVAVSSSPVSAPATSGPTPVCSPGSRPTGRAARVRSVSRFPAVSWRRWTGAGDSRSRAKRESSPSEPAPWACSPAGGTTASAAPWRRAAAGTGSASRR
jgi:acyl-coenzyme A synthetase/AMP-(fatty) acid ligase